MTPSGLDSGPSMPPDLDRLLATATVPAMPADLIDRIVAEAARPDRRALPAVPARRSPNRRWTRRGVWTGVVAVNLMLATAVAAAFGGGALSFARIATVARHVVDHIRAPFHHAATRVVPVRPAVVHRLAVPAAAIATAPRVPMPMSASRAFARPPIVARPSFQQAMPVHGPMRGPVPSPRSSAIDRAHPPLHAGPYAVRHAAPRFRLHEGAREPLHHALAHRGDAFRAHPRRAASAEPRAPMASPIAPRAEPPPRTEGAVARETPAIERGLQGEGPTRVDGPRSQTRADDRANDRAGLPGQGQDRAPGWRRRMQGEGGGGLGWRRRGGWGGGLGRPGGRMKPPRPGAAGRHPRRF